MVELIRWMLLFFVLAISSTAYGNEYKGFTKLDPSQCVPLDKEQVVSQSGPMAQISGFHQGVPTETGENRFCTCVDRFHLGSRISGVSTAKCSLARFSIPIIINDQFERIGQLSELYPSDWVTDLKIRYGKWQSDIPTEIRVDVENPAVSGDYYYAPLIWNAKSGRYEMKDVEPKNGKRL